MKKIIFILICVISLIAFSACGSNDKSEMNSGNNQDNNANDNADNNAVYSEQGNLGEANNENYDNAQSPAPPENYIVEEPAEAATEEEYILEDNYAPIAPAPAAEVAAAPAAVEAPAVAAASPASAGTPNAPAPAVEVPAPTAAVAATVPDGGFPDEEYQAIKENPNIDVLVNSVITFSLKVDSASYRNIARYINDGGLPPKDAVRLEEMINYFKYDEILPANDSPFSIYTEIGESPFNPDNYLAFVRVKSKDIDKSKLPHSNLTFLIDTSGSMDSYDKLPLLKSAFSLLVDTLTEDDIVSIVTYAGNANVLLDSVRGNRKDEILSAIDGLTAEGSTAGADGLNTAYALAEKNFRKDGNNRVILATDGDFNVGVSTVNELENMMSAKRESGIYLTVLGFGTENLKDNKMETIAKNGSGNYHYIDSSAAAKKVLVDELSANLFTIADDVKAQVEFNPALVSSYRLIGYENSMMKNKDFNNDKKDAGEIGAGTDVVLMFELELKGGAYNEPALKYQPDKNTSTTSATKSDTSTYTSVYNSNDRNGGAIITVASENLKPTAFSDELFEVRIRYKNPGEAQSMLITLPVKTDRIFDFNSNDFVFAASVAGFGQLLRGSQYTGSFTADKALAMAKDSVGQDQNGYRKEFIELVKKYQTIR